MDFVDGGLERRRRAAPPDVGGVTLSRLLSAVVDSLKRLSPPHVPLLTALRLDHLRGARNGLLASCHRIAQLPRFLASQEGPGSTLYLAPLGALDGPRLHRRRGCAMHGWTAAKAERSGQWGMRVRGGSTVSGL